MRKGGLDLCRVIGCLGVVMIHTVMLFWDFDPASPVWAAYNALSASVRFSVPLFFLLSGALLLGRETLELKRHLRRTLHFVLLFWLWSLICHGIDRLWLHVWNEGSFLDAVSGGYYHLWFLPAMALCYCAMPLLHALVHADRQAALRGAGVLAAILAALGLLRLTPLAPAARAFDFRYLLYLGYVLLGWALSRRKLPKWVPAALVPAAVAAIAVTAHLNRLDALRLGQASTRYYGYLTVSAALGAAAVFALCLRCERLPAKAAAVLRRLSGCVFGVYLLHPLFIDLLRSRHLDFTRFSALWFFPLCYVCFLLLSLAVTALLRRIPGLRKLVS